jgi:AcrR family transcriptional regulator
VETRISRSQPGSGQTGGKTRAANKRELILNAGLRLFSHQSYQNVTMEQVASLAGVGKGTLYLYYPSKEALYLGILRDGLDRTFGAYDSMLRSTEDVRDRLRKILFVALRYYDEQRDLLRLLVTHEPHLAEQRRALIKASRERMIQIIISLIGQGISEGLFRPVNPRLAAIAIQGAVSAISLYYKVPESGTSITEQLDKLITHGIEIGAIRNIRRAPPGRRKSSPVRLTSADLAERGS